MTTIALGYASAAAFRRDAEAQLVHSGLYIQRDLKLAQFKKVQVEITAPDGEVFSFEGEVVTVVPGAATAIQLAASSKEAIAAARAHAAASAASAAASAGAGAQGTAEDPAIEVSEDAPEALPPLRAEQLSVQAQIDAMDTAGLRNAAIHGGKDMRFLLARHLNKTLHSFVLKNPAIQVDEVEQMARMTSFNPNALHEIAVHREWSKNASVIRALVRNPKTPMPDALRMIDKLALSECQALMKSGALRMPLLNAVKRRVRGD